MFIIFDLIFLIYAVLYLPYLLLTGRWYKGFQMRFGIFPLLIREKLLKKQNIWIHAVSVGEVIVIDGIITELRKRYPQYQYVATVTTKMGLEIAYKRLADKAIVIPAPLDLSFIVSRFLRLIKPKVYIAAETEIWPNLLLALESRCIQSVLVNGRISDRSYPRYRLIRWILKPILSTIDMLGMQSHLDAKRIISLGASEDKVKVFGNVKFDDVPEPCRFQLHDYGFDSSALLFIGGSTHPGEEEIMLKAYDAIQQLDPRWHLVLAPRHIERADDVLALVKKHGLEAVKLTQMTSQVRDKGVVLIVDTIGHLRSLYALAEIVFVGKSLCVGGGHNIIEPAYFAKPVLVGPKMENFRDIMQCFKEGEGIIQVQDEDEFIERVRALAQDENLRRLSGQKSKGVIGHYQGAVGHVIQWLEPLLFERDRGDVRS